jgi:hypothetical protein
VPDPSVAFGEPVAGDETVARARSHSGKSGPLAKEERKSRFTRGRVLAVLAGLAVVGGGVAAAVVVLSDDGSTGGGQGGDGPNAGTDTGDIVAEAAPTDFTAVDRGDTVDLTWTDRSDGELAYVVSVFPESIKGEPDRLLNVEPGLGALTVRDLDPAVPYCFRLVGVGRDAEGELYRTAVDQQVRGCEVLLPPPTAPGATTTAPPAAPPGAPTTAAPPPETATSTPAPAPTTTTLPTTAPTTTIT